MVLTLDIPDKIIERAAELGMPIDTFILQTLDKMTDHNATTPDLDPAALRRAEATRTIREIASRNTLGGLEIKELIEEGRL